MKIGVLGTGVVGRTIAGKVAELGQATVVGTRDPDALRARAEPDFMGNPPFSQWHAQHQDVGVAVFADAAAHGEVVVNATGGMASLDALRAAREENLKGKVVVDIANPLDFSGGMPPSLSVCNTDSLGEQIQQAFPEARVVKTLNTVTAAVMVDPGLVAGGQHAIFVGGNDADAKSEVTEILQEWFGWKQVIDLGDITAARAMEMYLPLWLRLFGVLGNPMFNVAVVADPPYAGSVRTGS
ncbi:MAG: NADPH-dependent F420 reductase [Actinomycetota bacterium]